MKTISFTVTAGSSPRGRGKLAAQMREGLAARLIPAWAGKTRGRDDRDDWVRAHPRVGGENSICGDSLTYP